MKEENQSCEINSKKINIIIFIIYNIVSSINIPDISIFPDKSGKLI